MKRLLLFLLCASSLSAASNVQTHLLQTQTCTAAGNSCNITITTTAGNMLFVGNCAVQGTVDPTLTITRSGETFVAANVQTRGGASGNVASITKYIPVTAASSQAVACSRVGVANQLIGCIAAEYSQTWTGGALDGINSTNATTTTPSSGNAVIKYGPETIVGFFCNTTGGGTMTAGSGYTSEQQITSNVHAMLEDKLQYVSNAAVAATTANITSTNESMNVAGFVIQQSMLQMF